MCNMQAKLEHNSLPHHGFKFFTLTSLFAWVMFAELLYKHYINRKNLGFVALINANNKCLV